MIGAVGQKQAYTRLTRANVRVVTAAGHMAPSVVAIVGKCDFQTDAVSRAHKISPESQDDTMWLRTHCKIFLLTPNDGSCCFRGRVSTSAATDMPPEKTSQYNRAPSASGILVFQMFHHVDRIENVQVS